MHLLRLKYHLTDGRWNWFVRGLPNWDRSSALFQVREHTMAGFARCKQLWDLCHSLTQRPVPGAFVECGVWRGGSSGIMGCALKSSGQARPLHLFDSFEGLPEPGPLDGPKAADYSEGRAPGRLTPISRCDATLDEVRSLLFNRLRLDPIDIHFHVGWFQETVPASVLYLGPLALLRLDGDWYESTRICLQYLYPLLSPGGALILDAYYYWEGCQKATDDYRLEHNITAPIVRVDRDCGYWIKKDG